MLAPRAKKLQTVLEEEGIDVYLALEPYEVSLIAGRKLLGYPYAAAVVTRNDVKLIAYPIILYEALEARVDEVIIASKMQVYTGDAKPYNGDIVSALKELLSEYNEVRVASKSAVPLDLAEALGAGKFKEAPQSIMEALVVKEPFEIEAIKRAVDITGRAFERALEEALSGASEAEASAVIEEVIRRSGGVPSFNPIVAFDENTIYPHAEPGGRRLNDTAILDLGACVDCMCSDMTRTYTDNPRVKAIVEAVSDAIDEALSKLEPGVKAEELYKAARARLERDGLARYFIHGLGHGVGVEVHEPPGISMNSKARLLPGMVITIEPGVYIKGWRGVRIEELVLVTTSGFEVLTSSIPRFL